MLKKGTYKTRKGYTAVVNDICIGADFPLRGHIIVEYPDDPEPITVPSITWTSTGRYHMHGSGDPFDLMDVIAEPELKKALSILRELYDFAEYPALGTRHREKAERAFEKAAILLTQHSE